jgi:hypothetical protein
MPQPGSSAIPDEQSVEPAIKLLADVRHLWVDGYISKAPNSAAPDAISKAKFDEIECFLAARGISVDYCGWKEDSSSIGTEPMPERLVSDFFIENARQQASPTIMAAALLELQQWRKWAAAKGSTEVEGK